MMTVLFNHNNVIYPVGIRKPHVCLPWATDLLIHALHASNTISWRILQESAGRGGAGMETFWCPMRLCGEVSFSEHVTLIHPAHRGRKLSSHTTDQQTHDNRMRMEPCYSCQGMFACTDITTILFWFTCRILGSFLVCSFYLIIIFFFEILTLGSSHLCDCLSLPVQKRFKKIE